MAEENINTTTNEGTTGMEADYLTQIQELKNNTVSKESYDAMLEENRKLLNSLVNGQQVSTEAAKDDKPDIGALRKKLFTEDAQLSNLDYCKTALELRDALIEEGQPDPFLPFGKNAAVTDDDIKASNEVAMALRHCIDYADGDSHVFTNELQRILVDSVPRRRRS